MKARKNGNTEKIKNFVRSKFRVFVIIRTFAAITTKFLITENGGLNGRYFNLFRKFESCPGR
jgi:hypothetical protein